MEVSAQGIARISVSHPTSGASLGDYDEAGLRSSTSKPQSLQKENYLLLSRCHQDTGFPLTLCAAALGL